MFVFALHESWTSFCLCSFSCCKCQILWIFIPCHFKNQGSPHASLQKLSMLNRVLAEFVIPSKILAESCQHWHWLAANPFGMKWILQKLNGFFHFSEKIIGEIILSCVSYTLASVRHSCSSSSTNWYKMFQFVKIPVCQQTSWYSAKQTGTFCTSLFCWVPVCFLTSWNFDELEHFVPVCRQMNWYLANKLVHNVPVRRISICNLNLDLSWFDYTVIVGCSACEWWLSGFILLIVYCT